MKIEKRDRDSKCKYIVWNDYESQVIGSATLVNSERPVYLKEINVHRNRRGKGIGSRLLKRIVSDFEDCEIVAEVFDSRLEWYRRHGFDEEEELEQLVKVRRDPQ